MTDATSDFLEAEARRFLEKVTEHCDSVRIFITAPDGNGSTDGFSIGYGNWHAQHGQVREWLIRADERVRLSEKDEHESSQ